MRRKLIDKILAAEPLPLANVKPGDVLMGFEAWGCVPDNARRTVQRDEKGELFVACSQGKHYLNGQKDKISNLVGMIRV